jgi:hypothetical protein
METHISDVVHWKLLHAMTCCAAILPSIKNMIALLITSNLFGQSVLRKKLL